MSSAALLALTGVYVHRGTKINESPTLIEHKELEQTVRNLKEKLGCDKTINVSMAVNNSGIIRRFADGSYTVEVNTPDGVKRLLFEEYISDICKEHFEGNPSTFRLLAYEAGKYVGLGGQ